MTPSVPTHIQVWINQVAHTLPAPSVLADAVEMMGLQPPFAAAVNMQFVPRTQYRTHALRDQDHIELISPITCG